MVLVGWWLIAIIVLVGTIESDSKVVEIDIRAMLQKIVDKLLIRPIIMPELKLGTAIATGLLRGLTLDNFNSGQRMELNQLIDRLEYVKSDAGHHDTGIFCIYISPSIVGLRSYEDQTYPLPQDPPNHLHQSNDYEKGKAIQAAVFYIVCDS